MDFTVCSVLMLEILVNNLITYISRWFIVKRECVVEPLAQTTHTLMTILHVQATKPNLLLPLSTFMDSIQNVYT